MKQKILFLIALIVGVSLFAAACGSSDDDDTDLLDLEVPNTNTIIDPTTTTAQTTTGEQRDTTTTQRAVTVGDECTEERKGGELNFGVFSETSGLDPTVSSGSGVTGAIELTALYGTLMLQNQEDGSYEPWLAESLTPNEDFDIWTLTLRDDVTFGNGDKMTTTHVRDSIQRFVNPENPAIQRNQSGAWVAFIENYVIIDELTMEFHLDGAWSTFPFTLADETGMIVNTDVIEESGGVVEFNRNPEGGGAGPYEIVRYVPQDEIVLRAKDDWWGGPVCIETLRFTHVSGAEATYEAWKNDELQGAFLREPVAVSAAINDGNDNAFTFIKNTGGVILTNNGVRGSQTPTSDVRLRQAIALAVDASVVDQRADRGLGFPYKALLHTDSIFYDAELFPEIETNLEEAQRLVAEVKAEGNWDGSIRLDCYNVPSRVDWAIAVKAYLEAAGFRVTVNNDGTINDMIGAVLVRADYDLACWGFNMSDLEPVNALLQHTCTSPSNRTGYCDERMDAAIGMLRTAANEEEIQEAYAEVWSVWSETMPSVPLNLTLEYVLFQDNVKGVIDSQTSIVSFHKAYIEQ